MAGLRLFNFTQQLLELSMRVRGMRHEILTANIANVDTPGYKPKDIDFASIMNEAAEMDDSPISREQQMEQLLASPLDLQSKVYEPMLSDSQHGEDRLDRNGVGLDQQIAQMSENSLSFETSLTLLSRTLAKLRYVISDGRA